MTRASVPSALVVLLQGHVAGMLRRSASASLTFEYDPAWRDVRDRDEQLRALRLELKQLKEIDLKPRSAGRRAPAE